MRGVKIHRENCPNAVNLRSNYSYRILSAKWINSKGENSNAILKLKGVDKLRMLGNITDEIYKAKVRISSHKYFSKCRSIRGGYYTMCKKSRTIK